MIPLSMVEEQRSVRIAKIVGGRGLILKLLSLGLIEGELVKVIHNSQGPLLISIGNSRIAIGKGISHKILVEYV